MVPDARGRSTLVDTFESPWRRDVPYLVVLSQTVRVHIMGVQHWPPAPPRPSPWPGCPKFYLTCSNSRCWSRKFHQNLSTTSYELSCPNTPPSPIALSSALSMKLTDKRSHTLRGRRTAWLRWGSVQREYVEHLSDHTSTQTTRIT